ncbi:PmoA family protein [Paenibacillus sp. TRM 82003]|nr:PmoA family protein [Paenibacillus sp. TRM 82003]
MIWNAAYDAERSLWSLKSADGAPLLEYVFGEADDPNPSFRTVRTPAGHDVALYRPWDHPWHPGLFFSWKYINGLNFWESMYHGQRNVAVTDAFEPDADGGAGFRQSLSYVAEAGETLVREERRVTVEPGAAEGGYVIRWSASFVSATGADVTLDRTVITEQSPWGGYAGLSCRLARNLLGPVVTTNEGVFDAGTAHAKPYRWCDYAGKLDGFTTPRWAGVALLDSPANPRHPTHVLTYDYKDMQFLQAAFLCHEPYVLKPGETLKLEYALYVHDGEASAEELESVWARAVGGG